MTKEQLNEFYKLCELGTKHSLRAAGYMILENFDVTSRSFHVLMEYLIYHIRKNKDVADKNLDLYEHFVNVIGMEMANSKEGLANSYPFVCLTQLIMSCKRDIQAHRNREKEPTK